MHPPLLYDLIKNDLLEVVDNKWLSSEIIPGRAHIYAAKALLGKVLIYRSGYPMLTNEWSMAREMLGDVINSGEFEFFDSYEDILPMKMKTAVKAFSP